MSPRKSTKQDVVSRLWVIGKKLSGLGELVQFRQDDSMNDSSFALGEILIEIGADIQRIRAELEGVQSDNPPKSKRGQTS